MKRNKLFAILFSSIFFTILSCSRQQSLTTVSTPPVTTLSPFNTDNLLTVPELAVSDYLRERATFYTPAIEITDTFIGAEKYLVRAKTEKLFEKRNELLIDLGQMEEHAFSFPLPGARLLSPYGIRRGRNHTGIDIKTFAHDTVRAAFDGVVRIAGRAKGYGNVIVLRHYNGLETVYGHHSRLLVKAGDKVKAGAPLGLEGRTGRATTDHLHFETRINGQPFDPAIIIDFASQKLHNTCIVFTPGPDGKIRIDQV
ncbi:MAG: M23 family metallopeptidase [Odoribacter sp.]|nr:M23 family metallopeptidase [Odoribacter sp.]